MPTAHLLCGKCGNDVTLLVEELIALSASVPKRRWPSLAWCEDETLLGAADVMNYGDWKVQLVDVAIPDGIASSQSKR